MDASQRALLREVRDVTDEHRYVLGVAHAARMYSHNRDLSREMLHVAIRSYCLYTDERDTKQHAQLYMDYFDFRGSPLDVAEHTFRMSREFTVADTARQLRALEGEFEVDLLEYVKL